MFPREVPEREKRGRERTPIVGGGKAVEKKRYTHFPWERKRLGGLGRGEGSPQGRKDKQMRMCYGRGGEIWGEGKAGEIKPTTCSKQKV